MDDYRPTTSAEAAAACAEVSALWRAIVQHMETHIDEYPLRIQQLYANLLQAQEWRNDVANRLKAQPPR